jgi:hypothetical protein
MGNELDVWGATLEQIQIYYVFVFITFVYFLYKYREQKFALYIILLFYSGLAGFIGKDFQNIYKIIITLLTIYWLMNIKSLNIKKENTFFAFSFLIFTLVFLLTAYINSDNFFIIFSQYSRYFIIFTIFLIFIHFRDNIEFKKYL